MKTYFKMIFPICIFLVLFQTSTQFPHLSLESFNEKNSSAFANYVEKIADVFSTLKPEEQQQLMENFVNHLLAETELHKEEYKIEHDLLAELDSIPKLEANNAIDAIKKFRKSIDAGRKTLDGILEKRKTKTVTNPALPEVMRNYETTWIQSETKKCDGAKSVLEIIDNMLCLLVGKNVLGTVDDQMEIVQGIQRLIKGRKKKMDENDEFNEHLREKMAPLILVNKVLFVPLNTTSTPSDSTPSLFLFDEEDVKEIRDIYNLWIKKIPESSTPFTLHLMKGIEKSGMSLPMFCKIFAESNVIRDKAAACEKRGDTTGRDVLLKTLEQPDYKKCEQIIEKSRPMLDQNMLKAIKGIWDIS